MNNLGITLGDVRTEAMNAIRELKAGTLDLKKAAEIHKMLNVMIDCSKTQVEFIKAIPTSIRERLTEESIKELGGTFTDPGADLDKTIQQIESSKQKPYEISKRP